MYKIIISFLFTISLVFNAVAVDFTTKIEQEYLEQVKNLDKKDAAKTDDKNLETDVEENDKTIDEDKPDMEAKLYMEDGLKIYGHDLFENKANYVTDKNVNVPDEYVIGSGDTITLQFWGRTNKAENLSVDRDGNIFSDVIGKFTLGGKTYEESKRMVQQVIAPMEGVNVSFLIDNTKTVKVLVSGSVSSPGYYVLNAFSSMTQAIMSAGGVEKNANIRDVAILRNGKVIDTVDYYELANNGVYKTKINKLLPNDVIFVPRSSLRVKITGAVKEEAFYDIKKGTTLKDALELAGGLKPDARFNDIILSRLNKDKVRVEVKNLNLSNKNAAGFVLADGDEIQVYSASTEPSNAIHLTGNVYFPGQYEYKEGLRISDIISDSTKILENTDVDSSYIVRKDAKSSEINLIQFSLNKIFQNPSSDENLVLEPYDKIVVVNKFEILNNIEIMVTGEVAKPGNVKAEKEASVYKMITKAGGFTSASNIDNIEIVTYQNGNLASKVIAVNESMATEAPTQGYIIVHSIYESISKDYVEVSGDVFNPGEYFFNNGMMISDVLKKAINKEDYGHSYTLLHYKTSPYGEREIYNISINGLNDRKADVLLNKNDKIEVKLSKKNTRKYVNIDGAVYDKGTYVYGEGMTIADAIIIAGGYIDSAYRDEVEIIRKTIDGYDIKQEYIIVKSKDFNSFKMMPNDSVVIKNISEYNKSEYVNLSGEFVFPGVYPIKKGEKLSTIIKRAGGFTDYAYLYGTEFKREKVRLEKQKMIESMISRLERDLVTNANIQAMTAASDATISSAELFMKTKDSFIESLKKVKADGRLVIAMSHPRLLKGSVNDIELENGDSVYVPKRQDYVTVSGAVLNQGAFVYNEKMEWKDYIKIAGGYLNNADKSNIYIMKANGTVQHVEDRAISWSSENDRWEVSYFTDSKMLQPGDNLIVPDNYRRIAWLRNIKDITQVLMQIAVTGGVAANLF